MNSVILWPYIEGCFSSPTGQRQALALSVPRKPAQCVSGSTAKLSYLSPIYMNYSKVRFLPGRQRGKGQDCSWDKHSEPESDLKINSPAEHFLCYAAWLFFFQLKYRKAAGHCLAQQAGP